jgi:hypothetical protein
MHDALRPTRRSVWREDSSRHDLQRLAHAIARRRRQTFHHVFRLVLAAVPPPRRPRWDMIETQRIATLRQG